MINEEFDLSKVDNVDWTDTFTEADDNAMNDKIQEFIDKHVEIFYIDKDWHATYNTPSFAITTDGKVMLCMPDGKPLDEGVTVQIGDKNPINRIMKPGDPFDSIKDMLCGMSLADMPDTKIDVINMDIEHLYGLPDSVGGLWVTDCAYLADLSGIPKNVNGNLKLNLHITTCVNTMPERIKYLYIGDGYFDLTKDVIDMLPYDIQYIKVVSTYEQPDQKLISLLSGHCKSLTTK